MQTLPSPISCGKKRHRDVRPYRRPNPMVIVVKRMREDFITEITAISVQLFFRKRLRPAGWLAGNMAPWTALTESMLYGLYLHVVPVSPKGAENATVMRHVAIPVGGPFPDAHRGEMRRLKRRHMP